MFVLFVSVFGVQIPVILHEDDFKIAADQELLQLIFLLSLSHMSQDKLNKLKLEKQKYKICCENPSQMENNFLNTVTITLKGTTIRWKKIFLSEAYFERSVHYKEWKCGWCEWLKVLVNYRSSRGFFPVSGCVHTTPEKFEFLRLGFYNNPQRKRSFSKTLFKQQEFENAVISFWCGRKSLWKRSFPKTMTSP